MPYQNTNIFIMCVSQEETLSIKMKADTKLYIHSVDRIYRCQ